MIILRREASSIQINTIDNAILWWVVVSVVTGTLLEMTYNALINRLGFAYNTIGLYFLFRVFIQNLNDFNRLLKALAIIMVPLAIAMIIETETGRNLFSVFGGVKEFSETRYGQTRSQGSFAHPILAGTFGATSIPLFVSLWFWDSSAKWLATTGIIAATIITLLAHSSGPTIAYLFAIIGMLMWPFRFHMRAIRWGILLGIIALHMVMKAPVWYIIARICHIIGGTGFHRSDLIDAAIRHFDEWWLLGTTSNAQWGFLMRDVTNQFVREAIDGGLLKLVLFITIIALCFRGIGLVLKLMQNEPSTKSMCVWLLGVALLTHVASFMSVSYFDQIIVFWYLLLATISNLSGLCNEGQNTASN